MLNCSDSSTPTHTTQIGNDDIPTSILKDTDNVSAIDALHHKAHKVSNNAYDSTSSLSSSSNEDDMRILELIQNIPDKGASFASKNQVVSFPKKVYAIQTFGDRQSLLNCFKEFSHTLSTRFLSSSVTYIFSIDNTFPICSSRI